MNIKNLIKGIWFSTLVSLSLASSYSGDCKKIESYIKSNVKGSVSNYLQSCKVNSSGKLTSLKISDSYLTENNIKNILSYKTIKELYYISECNSGNCIKKKEQFPSAISKLTNLTKLTFYSNHYKGSDESYEHYYYQIYSNTIKPLKNLKYLYFDFVKFSTSYAEEIATLTKLETIKLYNCQFESLNSFKNLKNLYDLKIVAKKIYETNYTSLHDTQLTEIPKFVFSLTKLKDLVLLGHLITKIPSELSTLKNLEYLDLHKNQIDDVIPESLNNLKKLTFIDFDNNVRIKGKTLTIDGLEECYYYKFHNSTYFEYLDFDDICIAKDLKCLKDYPYKKCGSKTGTISTNGRCGEDFGRCPSGKCCSKYGYCGVTDAHCGNGCQSEFGECNIKATTTRKNTTSTKKTKATTTRKNTTSTKKTKATTTRKNTTSSKKSKATATIKISTNGRCGVEYGRCPSSKCCSKYGYCGVSDEYCGNGCQSKYGLCN